MKDINNAAAFAALAPLKRANHLFGDRLVILREMSLGERFDFIEYNKVTAERHNHAYLVIVWIVRCCVVDSEGAQYLIDAPEGLFNGVEQTALADLAAAALKLSGLGGDEGPEGKA